MVTADETVRLAEAERRLVWMEALLPGRRERGNGLPLQHGCQW